MFHHTSPPSWQLHSHWRHNQGVEKPNSPGHRHQLPAELRVHEDRQVEGLADCSEAVISHDCQENTFCATQSQEHEEPDGTTRVTDSFVWAA